MKNISKLIKEFKKAREGLIVLIDQFPKDKRKETLFDKWSLKDIIIHLTGWAEHQQETLKALKTKRESISPQNLKNLINTDLVSKKARTDWTTLYNKFVKISGQLIAEYEDLPKELWKKKIWKDKDTTPVEYVKIEINHYKNTHGTQIEKVLKRFWTCLAGRQARPE